MKKTIRIIALLLTLLQLSACAAAGEVPQTVTATPGAGGKPGLAVEELQTGDTLFTDRDLNGTWDDAAATHITLGAAPVIEGDGAEAGANVVTLTNAGVYVLAGEMQGQIAVEAGKNDKLQIVLNGASVTAADGPALYIKTADKVFLTIAGGTANALSDGASYAADEEEPDGAIYSKADLAINGAGTLNVNGAYEHGIVSKDDLILADATFNITAAGDGARGKDCIKAHNATLNITAAGDGMQSNRADDADLGYVLLDGGAYNINAAADGIQAETRLEASGGVFNIVTGGGRAAAPEMTRGGAFPGMPGNAQAAQTTAEKTASAKGLKAGTDITVRGGTYALDAMDDAVHANGSVTLQPESMTIASGDDGIHADGALSINGGTISVTQSYEGLEGNSVTILDGVITVTAFDDGVNAAGGADSAAQGGRYGADQFASDPTKFIDIRGGTLIVDASGDGLDSNGDFRMSGGAVTVSGSADAGNGALDYNGKGEISGGTIIAAGNAAMTQSFSDTSAQCVLAVYYTKTQEEGKGVTLKDGENVLVAFAPQKAYSMAVISAPGMEKGKTYTLYSDNDKLADVTLSGVVTGVDETGEAAGGMGGFGMQGGAPGGRGGRGQANGGGVRPEGTPPAGMQPPEGMPEPPAGGMGQPPQGAPQGGAA
ncbi:MAG: carbohydrate-binding domain-containing protein [Clostridia bacterium]|nr:carbohydrate-binding domain-containing protein [Clostridia bacterium]